MVKDNVNLMFELMLEFQKVYLCVIVFLWCDLVFKIELLDWLLDMFVKYFGYQCLWIIDIDIEKMGGDYGWMSDGKGGGSWNLLCNVMMVGILEQLVYLDEEVVVFVVYCDVGLCYLFICC